MWNIFVQDVATLSIFNKFNGFFVECEKFIFTIAVSCTWKLVRLICLTRGVVI